MQISVYIKNEEETLIRDAVKTLQKQNNYFRDSAKRTRDVMKEMEINEIEMGHPTKEEVVKIVIKV